MYKLLLLLIVCALTTTHVSAQNIEELTQAMIEEVSVDNLSDHVKVLEDAGGNRSRITFTPGVDSAATYVLQEFNSIPGITSVEVDTFFIASADSPYNTKAQVNVIATFEGAKYPEQMYVIGAHLDATADRDNNWGGRANWDTIEAPGADDNATGVAAILEIARILTESDFNPDYTIKLVAFGAEERGAIYSGNHHGSIHFAQNAVAAGEEILGMVSVDMIGFNHDYDYASLVKLDNEMVNESIALAQKYVDANQEYSIGLKTAEPPFESGTYSDHQSFAEEGIPSILIIENAPWQSHTFYRANPYYHTSYDTFGQLNMGLVKKVTQVNLAVLTSLTKIETGVEEEPVVQKFRLAQNYPNPFNPSTVIEYELKQPSDVSLKVYDLLGNEVAVLVNERRAAGSHSVEFNAQSLNRELASGIYIYRLTTPELSQSHKMVLLK